MPGSKCQLTYISVLISLLAMTGGNQALAQPIHIDARPIPNFSASNPDRTLFGKFEYQAGLVLTSKSSDFGGFSGMMAGSNNNIIQAVSDQGWFLHATLERSPSGKITGVTNAALTPILDNNGHRFNRKWKRDAETITSYSAGTNQVAIGFENNVRIQIHGMSNKRPGRALKTMSLQKLGRNRNGNATLEALVSAPASNNSAAPEFLAIFERKAKHDPGIPGWIMASGIALPFWIQEHDSFAITEANLLSNGDLIILERRASIFGGVQNRIRHILRSEIYAHNMLDGEVIFTAGSDNYTDNLEGMSTRIVKPNRCETLLVSDDNYSFLQNTILLQFHWDCPTYKPASPVSFMMQKLLPHARPN
ncbi:MAG: esterase-like activity of phytase family protein [Cohaesibacteraceae bacterium]|nr:esterase-like activity of phytase family protein [Cohaesibacteraceae bacterium]